MMTKVAKYGYLLEDKNVKSWHDNLYVRSPITAEVYFRTMGPYCELNYTSPSQIIEDSRRNLLTVTSHHLKGRWSQGARRGLI
ncbi:MAG: hypothetical protein LVQ63_06435 [Thermoplasmatales archaeon]|nr:hypothetical protein [Thermoplasmatales archaeon]